MSENKNLIPPELSPFIKHLVDSINDRVKKLVDNKLLRIAVLLDPRFAFDESIFSKTHWPLIEEDLLEFAKLLQIGEENQSSIEEASTSVIEINEEDGSDDSINCINISRYFVFSICIFKFIRRIPFLVDIWKPKSKLKSPGTASVPSTLSGESQSGLTTRIPLQLATMKALGRPPPDSNIFTWWRENGPQFPDLAILARIVHSVPATSVCSERLFSKAGLIYGN